MANKHHQEGSAAHDAGEPRAANPHKHIWHGGLDPELDPRCWWFWGWDAARTRSVETLGVDGPDRP